MLVSSMHLSEWQCWCCHRYCCSCCWCGHSRRLQTPSTPPNPDFDILCDGVHSLYADALPQDIPYTRHTCVSVTSWAVFLCLTTPSQVNMFYTCFTIQIYYRKHSLHFNLGRCPLTFQLQHIASNIFSSVKHAIYFRSNLYLTRSSSLGESKMWWFSFQSRVY